MTKGIYPRPEPLVRFRTKWKLSETHSYNGEACWTWIAYTNKDGYGHFYVDGKTVRAHRWSYEHFREPIPEGLVLDHLCRNPSCVNPTHLEAVTCRENLRRGEGFGAINARKTHCPQLHAYDRTNTRIQKGRRHCRICQRESAYRRYHERKGLAA